MFFKIDPHYLCSFVSFERKSPDWEYSNVKEGMYEMQARGAAKVWNYLCEKGIALLADEVGMGKTIQSLSVMAALFQQKATAKVLIVAPRDAVAVNWEKEYYEFIESHYRHRDELLKSALGQDPRISAMIRPVYCKSLDELRIESSVPGNQVFIIKTTSFSYLGDTTEEIELVANTLREQISVNFEENNKPFDLLVIDEAHYFRNIDGGSNRSIAAKCFFGANENERIAHKVLLLTATPNHSGPLDIKSILRYFKTKSFFYNGAVEKSYSELLEEVCVRRLRRLGKKEYTKYHYRNELALKSTFETDIKSEFFFALYQRQLLYQQVELANSNSKISYNRFLTGYLEGLEFIPNDVILNDDKSIGQKDYTSNVVDSILIRKLSKEYFKFFNETPKHPKYDLITDRLSSQKSLFGEKKAVVFVRRIASASEMADRIIRLFDQDNYEKIKKSIGQLPKLKPGNKTKELDRFLLKKIKQTDKDDIFDEHFDRVFIEPFVKSSFILELFSNKLYKSGFNFRVRFTKKESLFSVFFMLGEDGYSAPYTFKFILASKTEKGKKDYKSTATQKRLAWYRKRLVIDVLNVLEIDTSNLERKPEKLKVETFFTVLLPMLSVEQRTRFHENWDKLTILEREGFANYIHNGILKASGGVVDLFCCYLRCVMNASVDYTSFIKEFKKFIKKDTSVIELLLNSIDTFKLISEKVFQKHNENDIYVFDWSVFNGAQPAYPYTGNTKNERVRNAFNTPFFPRVLVSTSVLQEGVNLQFQCDEVIHYGTAWTPGDNEQRNGRVDRMFSLVERNINSNIEKPTLDIVYPYLAHTIDEDHLGNFVIRKTSAEKLLDELGNIEKDSGKVLDYTVGQQHNWNQWLRRPLTDPIFTEKFSVKHFELEKREKSEIDTNILLDLIAKIQNSFKNLEGENGIKEVLVFKNVSAGNLCCINPVLSTGRHQPVMVDLEYSTYLTGLAQEKVYLLKLRSPLGKESELKRLFNAYDRCRNINEQYWPFVKICYDGRVSNNSNWKVYSSVELPLFVKSGENPLSRYELEQSLEAILSFSDRLEKLVYNRDLSISDIGVDLNNIEEGKGSAVLSRFSNMLCDNLSEWHKRGDYIYKSTQRKLSLANAYPYFKEIIKLNHIQPFLNFTLKNDNEFCVCYLSYLKKDINYQEKILLDTLYRTKISAKLFEKLLK